MKRSLSHILIVGGWLLFTVSLSLWWMIYGLQQISRLAAVNQELPEQVFRSQRMLHWEGGSLIMMVILGGMGLLYYSHREFQRNQSIKEFFATLTHELKTPLASLRLQVESLQEDLAGTQHLKLVDRLVRDAARLELQLENALFLASVEDAKLHLENLRLGEVLAGLKEHWPELEIGVTDQCIVRADTRALEGVLKNLVQNARVHGHATKVRVSCHHEDGRVKLAIEDNGSGFRGDAAKLGHLFTRHTAVSGSGVGLYLARQLAKKMNGDLTFDVSGDRGFKAYVLLEKGSA